MCIFLFIILVLFYFISNKKLVKTKAEICHNVKFHQIAVQKVETEFNLIFQPKNMKVLIFIKLFFCHICRRQEKLNEIF